MSCISQSTKSHLTLTSLIDSYIRDRRHRLTCELDFYRCQKSLRDAVRKAALSIRCDGRRHNHQRRLNATVLKRAADRLESASARLGVCKNFDALMRVVENELRGVRGVGELTRYDIALRIGAKRCLEPQRVYLHAGTRQGAKAIGLNATRDAIETKDLQLEFRRLKPHEIEDCLCIYKDQLWEIMSRRRSPASLIGVALGRVRRARGCR
jgi:hypothetical protein